jgi:hypothetical protein
LAPPGSAGMTVAPNRYGRRSNTNSTTGALWPLQRNLLQPLTSRCTYTTFRGATRRSECSVLSPTSNHSPRLTKPHNPCPLFGEPQMRMCFMRSTTLYALSSKAS